MPGKDYDFDAFYGKECAGGRYVTSEFAYGPPLRSFPWVQEPGKASMIKLTTSVRAAMAMCGIPGAASSAATTLSMKPKPLAQGDAV